MENRELVIADYFELRRMLNKANPVPNQKTEVEFAVIRNGPLNHCLIATLSLAKDAKFIEICRVDTRTLWRPAGYSGLFYLEEFCTKFLRKNLKKYFSNEELTTTTVALKKELQSLGIPS